MRKVVYGCAMSLDGFIAGANGEHDWIVMDPDIDFAALMRRFDTFLIGRKTFEMMRRMGNDAPPTAGIGPPSSASARSSGFQLKVGYDGIQPSRADWASRSAVVIPANLPWPAGEANASTPNVS